MPGGRPPVIEDEEYCQRFVAKVDEMREIGLKWTVIAKRLDVSDSFLLKWRRKIDYDDPFRQSDVSDADLDELIAGIQEDHPERGERMVMAYLKGCGVHVPRARMRASIHRVNPEGVSYRAHIATPRVEYSVPGPHHLWHVDGNHKLIEFGIAIEGGIDGYTRACLFLKAVTKYNADIVLDMFKEAVSIYTVPSRVRTDKGTENVKIAKYMLRNRGTDRGSIIAGKSTRNQRIERLWLDVKKEVLRYYIRLFNGWVESYFLNFTSMRVKFVIHTLFMDRINADLARFRCSWNEHQVSTEGNLSPNQMLFLNAHLIKAPPAEIVEDEYGESSDDEEGIAPHQKEYEPVVHPFSEEQLAYFRRVNPPFCLADTCQIAMWQRVEQSFDTYDRLINSCIDDDENI
jgi:hypothetical protein